MADRARWGIVGTGQIAEGFARDLQASGRAIVAVGSRTRAGAEGFAGRLGIGKAHGSYEALVADPEVDIVYVATPHPMHAGNARLGLEAGKHVLVEKPFAMNAREAEAVVALAAARGLVVLEAMKTRFLPHMVRVRELVRAGALGKILAVTADLAQRLPDDPAHRINALALGGGALLDLGVYPIALAADLLGQPQSISAAARFKPTGADAQVTVLLTHSGGATALLMAASDAIGANRATIVGSHGRIEIDAPWNKPAAFRLFDEQNRVGLEFNQPVAGRGLQFEAAEVERLAAAGQLAGETLPPAESVAIMRTLDAIRAAIGLKYPGE